MLMSDLLYLLSPVLLGPHCTVLYCTVLYCTVLYCTVLYCTVDVRPVVLAVPGVAGAALRAAEVAPDGPEEVLLSLQELLPLARLVTRHALADR